MMSPGTPTRRPLVRFVVIGLAVVVGAAIFWWCRPVLASYWRSASAKVVPAPPAAPEPGPKVELASAHPPTLRVPKELIDGQRYRTAAAADAPTPEPLHLHGTTITDPNRNARVVCLFAGSVVRIGVRGDQARTSEGLSTTPDVGLRPGDEVKKGQILAVVWSKDVGEKKSALVDAMSKLWADQKILDRYKSVEPGVVTLTLLTQAEQAVQSDKNAVATAERTLRSWQLPEEDVAAVRREAELLFKGEKTARDREVERSWAEVAIRAPFDGVVLEKNVTVGDTIDPTVVLFKLSKLDRLEVIMNVYEEDLPKLQHLARAGEAAAGPAEGGSPGLDALRRDQAHRETTWTLTFQANGATETAAFDRVGVVIDPTQHSGTVSGWVDNRKGNLFVGQFVTATVPLKPDPTLVAVPTSAVVEDADGSTVFVATDPAARLFVRRKVAVAVRGREQIFLRKQPTPAEAARGAEPVKPGETVLATGAVDLAGELTSLLTTKKE